VKLEERKSVDLDTMFDELEISIDAHIEVTNASISKYANR